MRHAYEEGMNTNTLKLIRLAVAGTSIFSLLTFSSCSTTKGFGQDLQKLGHEIQEEADEHL
jgi:predicted small secreted protein